MRTVFSPRCCLVTYPDGKTVSEHSSDFFYFRYFRDDLLKTAHIFVVFAQEKARALKISNPDLPRSSESEMSGGGVAWEVRYQINKSRLQRHTNNDESHLHLRSSNGDVSRNDLMCQLVWSICIKWSLRQSDKMVRMIRWGVCAKTTNHRGELNELLPHELIISGAYH